MVAAALAALIFAAPAGAATITEPFRGELELEAAPREANDLTIAIDGETVTFTDQGAALVSDTRRCSPAGPSAFECTEPDLYLVTAGTGDGDDLLRARGLSRQVQLTADLSEGADTLIATGTGEVCAGLGDGDDVGRILTPTGACQVRGGPGDDKLSGSGGQDRLEGDEGDDVLYGSSGGDYLGGGAGDDRLEGGSGHDFILDGPGDDNVGGGAGRDALTEGPGNDALLGGAGADSFYAPQSEHSGNDVFDGGPGDGDSLFYRCGGCRLWLGGRPDEGADEIHVDDLSVRLVGRSGRTTMGADVVAGTEGANRIATGAGKDVIDPAGGPDHVVAGKGADRIMARDGSRDVIDCAEGRDAVRADASDVLRNCERVNGRRTGRGARPERGRGGRYSPALRSGVRVSGSASSISLVKIRSPRL